VRLAAQALPAVAVLDLQMPGLSGLAVCRTLRQTPATAPIRVVLMSAGLYLAAHRRDLDCAQALLPKPFDLAALLTLRARLLAR
jgi:CheY-like chemotaxis protein